MSVPEQRESAARLVDELLSQKGRRKRLERFLLPPKEPCCQGWYFYVPDCYRSALDTSLTDRITTVKLTGEDGKVIKRKITTRIWTQGLCFSFQEGDVFYDIPLLSWEATLKQAHFRLVVERAVPVAVERGCLTDEGLVSVAIYSPNHQATAFEKLGLCEITQIAFVRLLICGPEAVGENWAPSSASGRPANKALWD